MIAENKATFFASLNEGDLIKNIGLGLDYEATEEKIRDYAEHLREESPYDVEELAQLYLNEPRSFPSQLDYDFFKNNYDDILSVAMTGLNEGEAAYEYEKGKEAGEAIEKKKMKKSELKAKIKEMVVAEMDGPAVIDSEYDFLKEIENMLEADKETDVDVEAADDTTGEDTTAGDETVDTTVDVSTNEVDPNVKAVQDALTQAQAAAQQLGDKKLMDQIGNTITFFTRAHVVEKPGAAVAEELNESIFPILKRILK